MLNCTISKSKDPLLLFFLLFVRFLFKLIFMAKISTFLGHPSHPTDLCPQILLSTLYHRTKFNFTPIYDDKIMCLPILVFSSMRKYCCNFLVWMHTVLKSCWQQHHYSNGWQCHWHSWLQHVHGYSTIHYRYVWC